MVKQSRATTTPQHSTGGATPIQEFANGNLLPETLIQQASTLLTSKDLVRNLQGATQEDQTRFLDKVDQVCRDLPLF